MLKGWNLLKCNSPTWIICLGEKNTLTCAWHVTPKYTSQTQNKGDHGSKQWDEMKGLCTRSIAHFPKHTGLLEKGCLGTVWVLFVCFPFYKSNLGLSPSVHSSCFPKLKISSFESRTVVVPLSLKEGSYYLNRYKPTSVDSQWWDHF